MTTVYSLVCWGGRTGKTVTANSTTDIFTLTNHGNRDGSKRWFVSGIPTGLSYLVPYYTKSLSSSTFELYEDAALTTKALFTSNGSSPTLKSDYIVDSSILAAYGVDISRYGPSGSERIYDGFYSSSAARSNAGLAVDDEIIEFIESFDETNTYVIAGSGVAASYTFTTTINGTRTDAFHFGIVGMGYTYTSTGTSCFYTSQYNCVVDGFDFRRNNAAGGTTSYVCSLAFPGNVLSNSIVQNIGSGYSNGILVSGGTAFNNIVIGISPGYSTVAGIAIFSASLVYNNTVTKCGTGFIGYSGGGSSALIYNNLSVGNEVNWGGGLVYSANRANGNIGETTDLVTFTVTSGTTTISLPAATPLRLNQQIFLSSTGTLPSVGGTPLSPDVSYYVRGITGSNITIGLSYNGGALTFSDTGTGTHQLSLVWSTTNAPANHIDFSDPSLVFVDWANNDLRPAGSGHTPAAQALMVDTALYARAADITTDILGNERPNYNNGGAEAKDVGAFEFDHGYGPRPATATVAFDGIPAGLEIRVYSLATGTELAGVESCDANHVLSWPISSPPTTKIKIVGSHYKIKVFQYTAVSGSQSIPLEMEVDKWYSNPV